MLSDKIKSLRMLRMMTQTELAEVLGVTRSSVNAWEQGISTPSVQYLSDIAGYFDVSTDYLLGRTRTATVSVAGLDEEDVRLVNHLIEHLRSLHLSEK